jgi:glycosyltransferase involved in cell wall biosynthesis
MFFSIVIPTYNRQPILEKCLTALELQKFTDQKVSKYEIILVDDGSTDGTLEWLKTHQQDFPSVRVFQQDHQGPATARNLGVKMAQGEIIIFIDSDLVVTPCFLQSHAQCFN